tara:strand:- start:4425 stop:5066 length:642 start_codon:yes stop_codon:yes gene_type:complete
MIKRRSRYDVLDHLEVNPELNVVDLGCGAAGACPFADVLVDLYDHSSKFEGKKFVVHDLNDTPFPFGDNEFDFSFTSHILEHIKEPIPFLKEVVRISKSGYIEVPTALIDNLVSGNDRTDPNGHKWWCFFNDFEGKLILRPRRHIVHRTLDIPELNKLYPFFRSSFVLELYWEDSIDFEMGDEKYFYEEKEYDLSKDIIQPWVLGESILRVMQ